jgi:hypothetical protein
MLRKLIGTAAVLVLLSGGASSQTINMLAKERSLSPEETQREREIESQYRETVDKLPDKQKKSSDPWGNVRQAPAASSSAARQQR